MVTLDNGGGGRGNLVFHPVPPHLSWAVEHTWSEGPAPVRTASGRPWARGWRVVPDPSPHLIFTRSGRRGEAPGSLRLVGARTRHVDVDKTRRSLTVGVRLRPGVLPLLLRTPAAELVDRSEPLDRLLGRTAALLAEALGGDTPTRAARRLHGFLGAVLRPGELDWRAPAAIRLLDRPGGGVRSVAELARETGVAPRTLRRALRRAVGMGPKRLARIHRFHRAVALGRRPPGNGWAAVACRVGYADQAHLCREFRTLVGETPSAFLGRAGAC